MFVLPSPTGGADALRALPTTTPRLLRALPLVFAAGLVAYGLLATAGVLGLLLVIAALAGALALWTRAADPATQAVLRSTGTAALLIAPAVLVAFFSFSSGGFFPGSVALGAMAVGLLLVVRVGLAAEPLEAIGHTALVPLVGLAGLAGWALLSQLWSHAPGRAAIGFD